MVVKVSQTIIFYRVQVTEFRYCMVMVVCEKELVEKLIIGFLDGAKYIFPSSSKGGLFMELQIDN